MSQTLEEILQLIFPIGRPPDRKVSTLWGSFSIWDFSFFGRQYWIKTLEVNPQKRLSLQRHHFRSEFWIPASGEGVALIDGHKFAFQGQSEDGFSMFVPRSGIASSILLPINHLLSSSMLGERFSVRRILSERKMILGECEKLFKKTKTG